MSKEFARGFYSSEAWNRCRAAYKKSVGGLCENCLKHGFIVPGEIVHHKVHLTPANIETPETALSWENLELLCRECHAAEHGKKRKRFEIDEAGRVLAVR